MRHVDYYRVIRVLQAEGSDRQAERMRLQLYASGLRCVIRRVRSADEYVTALHQSWCDVVLLGGDLRDLDADGALRVVEDAAPYLPTVFALMDEPGGLARVVLGAVLQAREVRGRRVTQASRRAA